MSKCPSEKLMVSVMKEHGSGGARVSTVPAMKATTRGVAFGVG